VLRQLVALPAPAIGGIAANRHRIGRIDAFLAVRLAGLFKEDRLNAFERPIIEMHILT
jgi:hypothetical protein